MSRFDEEPDADPHGECAAEIHRLQDQIEALTSELESHKKDAKRYRWMRSQDGVTVQMSWKMPFPKNHIQGQPMTCETSIHGRHETLDKIVDQAIAKGTAA